MSIGRKIAMAVVAICGLIVLFINIVVMKKTDEDKKARTTVNKVAVTDIDKKKNEATTDEKKEDSVTRQMKAYSEKFNTYLPKDAGNGMIVKSTEVVGARSFKFIYSLNATAEKEYRKNFDESAVMKALVQQIKTDAMFRPFRTNDVTIICSYVDSKGEVVKDITVTPEDYK
ncbi:hypothetical protein M2451_001111 [Dysgonomonas sp. PFB1-18]|uniref:hypothetical protein n=1 Tax=unclassified Dysgonomonas TaxID=2630389 RepID=UPI002475F4E5|nr:MULTISPECIES: hypothetical protein [unclassified Dysgonomonas]MDH6308264.1 hypothetical protein [Dysgonomonas sp. PF1-14]MDH6338297.1 hypothetical protein [Dysgonomonas sp. PF1-16]MDH6379794.1 hypothetical protein [Dysgonomonas sp. PFB1-18]MDH6397116.1 hypothetical protein [Dysgonomonas sp. PF1-23]